MQPIKESFIIDAVCHDIFGGLHLLLFRGSMKQKRNAAIGALALIHWMITFFTDHIVFESLPGNGIFTDFAALSSDSKMHFVLCKILLLVLLVYLWKLLFDIAREAFCLWKASDKKEFLRTQASPVFRTLLFGLIYLVPILAVLAFKLPEGFLSNDESLIFGEASRLATYTWFYYLTTYYYIVTMMLIPSWLGPILVKVFLQLAVCGYVVQRTRNHFKDRLSFFMYVPFFLPPVLAYTTSAHRIPVYYLLYLLMIFVLVMDRLEKVPATLHRIFWIMVCGAVLTQWRTEGVYMAAVLPILLLLTYEDLRANRKKLLLTVCVSFLVQYLLTVPQTGFVADRLGDQADNRMGPFWAYTITNMYRNGLDLEKNKADMEMIWRYLDKDTLAAINQDLQDINYEDVLILYYPGYTGKIESATPEDYNAYVQGCKNIFLHNPGVLLKTRIGAFRYAAQPYHIQFTGLTALVISIIKTLAYNLYIPCLITLGFWVWSFCRKRWQEFFIWSGLCCHWFIVFVLAPASYFKYYFPIYMMGYFFAVYQLIGLCRSRMQKA